MRLFDIKIPTTTEKGTPVDDLYESLSESVKERNELRQRNEFLLNRYSIQGFRDILDMNFDMDKTFEKQCYLEGKYLCTVAHNVDDKYTGYIQPEKKAYNLVVTWPDGRQEDWTLSFYVYDDGENKGQFRELDGQKFMSEFIFTGKIH